MSTPRAESMARALHLIDDDQVMVASRLLHTLAGRADGSINESELDTAVEEWVLEDVDSRSSQREPVRSKLSTTLLREQRVSHLRRQCDEKRLGWTLAKETANGIRVMWRERNGDLPEELDAVCAADRCKFRCRQLAGGLYGGGAGGGEAADPNPEATRAANHPHLIELRLEGEVLAPTFHLLSLLREVDLYTEWIPSVLGLGIKEARWKHLERPTQFQVEVDCKLPPPLSTRRCGFTADGIDIMTEEDPVKQLAILLHDREDCNIPRGWARAGVRHSGILLTPQPWESDSWSWEAEQEASEAEQEAREAELAGAGWLQRSLSGLSAHSITLFGSAEDNAGRSGYRGPRTLLQLYLLLNVDMSMVPQKLVDIFLKLFAPCAINRIRDASKLVMARDGAYQVRMRAKNDQFYKLVRRRIREAMPGEAATLGEVEE